MQSFTNHHELAKTAIRTLFSMFKHLNKHCDDLPDFAIRIIRTIGLTRETKSNGR